LATISQKFDNIQRNIVKRIESLDIKINDIDKRISALTPAKKLDVYEREIELVYKKICALTVGIISRDEAILDKTVSHISVVNPMNVLSRGYSITSLDKQIVYSADSLKVGDIIDITLSKGNLKATITCVNGKEN